MRHMGQSAEGEQGQHRERERSLAEGPPLFPKNSLRGGQRHINGWARMAPEAPVETLLSLGGLWRRGWGGLGKEKRNDSTPSKKRKGSA